jgi:hypothetical protein
VGLRLAHASAEQRGTLNEMSVVSGSAVVRVRIGPYAQECSSGPALAANGANTSTRAATPR